MVKLKINHDEIYLYFKLPLSPINSKPDKIKFVGFAVLYNERATLRPLQNVSIVFFENAP